MLTKLLKHEFRATGRLMLPAYGALLLLAVLTNIAIRIMSRGNVSSTILRVVLILLIVAGGLGVFAIFLMTLVLMVTRFYRNLLKDEGYLMHTLPVNVHGLVWSKLIVSLVWFLASCLVVALLVFVSALLQTGTSLADVWHSLPSWAQIRSFLESYGVSFAGLGELGVLTLVAFFVGFFASCLHFYAAMSLGQMFNRDKVMLSVLFYVLISIVLTLLINISGLRIAFRTIDSQEFSIALMRSWIYAGLIIEGIQAVILYFTTTFSLRRGLNLG